MPDAYFPLDVNFFDHPKVVPLGDTAVRLELSAIGYANRFMTDGYITPPIPGRLVDVPWDSDITIADHIAELVKAVLWHEADEPCPRGHDATTCPPVSREGWRIHDFLEHNRSRAKRIEAQKQERDRKAAWRARQRESHDSPASPVTPLSRGTPTSRGRPGDGEYRDRDRDKEVPTHPEDYGPPTVVHKGSVENLSTSSQRRAKLRDPIGVADALAPITGQKPTRPTRDQLRWREEADKRAAAERTLREGSA